MPEFTDWAIAARPRLLRTATALTAGDRAGAEDLVQVTLTKTYLAWGRIRRNGETGEHPDRFAHQVLVRSFIDQTRGGWWRRERGTRELDPSDAALATTRIADPDDVLAIREALAQLPRDQRAAVLLRYWHGYDVNEAAELCGCTPIALRSRAFRGLARLRELLGEFEVEDDDQLTTMREEQTR